jgi:membrane protein
VPHTRVHLRSALYGAVIAGLLWQTSGIAFTSLVAGSTRYTAIYSGFAILLVFMIWLYLSWVILLIGASLAFYHQHPECLKWDDFDVHLSSRMRHRLALQAMVVIARAHDRQIDLIPSLENLAGYQQVPTGVLQRILDALQEDGLIRQSADDPPRYLPAASLQRIRLVDILRSAHQAEDGGNSEYCRDDQVSALLKGLEQTVATQLGDQTLADFLHKYEDSTRHEDSLV